MKKKSMHLMLLVFAVLFIISFKSYSQAWTITGNNNINPANNFLGTKNSNPVIFKTNNTERMRLLETGNFGIGIDNPVAPLHILSTKTVSLTGNGYFLLGNKRSYSIAMDASNIQARYKTTAADLYLNSYGGTVRAGNYSTSSYGVVGGGIYEGLYGYSYGATGIGTYGYSSTYFGVYGYTGGGSGTDPNYPAGVHGYNSGSGNGVTGYCVDGSGTVGWSDNYVGVWGYTGNTNSWAGYFAGNVYTTGTYQGSDEKLKQNINDFSSAMNIISQLHPKIYQYRQDGNFKSMNLPQGQHYGLIAQDVEKTLPNLVKETKQDITKSVETKMADPKDSTKQITVRNIVKTGESMDFKAVNYTELIPIIIKGMQEQQSLIQSQQAIIDKQQQQIDDLKQFVQKATASNAADAKASTISTDAYLVQNAPNPFSANTIIKCYVPSSAKQAQLVVYGMNGQLLKSYKLSTGLNSVSITAGSLTSGQYSYSLVTDGKKVDSKNMTITK